MLSKNVNDKKSAPKLVFFNEKKLRKIRMIFDNPYSKPVRIPSSCLNVKKV